MSKKLLEESTVRSFMKLANLQPLSEKFITEKYTAESSHDKDDKKVKDGEKDDKKLKEEELEEGETLEEETLEEEAAQEPVKEEAQEEGEVQEEGKESEGRPASKKEAPKGASLAGKTPGKMDAAKNAAGDAKLKPLKAGTHHSDKPDSIETKTKSNAPKKNNSQFEVVAESLEEMAPEKPMGEEMDSPEGGEMGGGAESGPHKDKMKELIRGMLNSLKDMGAEYGMSMEISDEGAGGEPEAPEAPEAEAPMGDKPDEMMQEKLDEMVEKLTKRVAARLVKESKKKR